jgi:hypothetical protein
MDEFGDRWNEFLEFMEGKVPARLLTLQRSSQHLKEVIKSVKLQAQICHVYELMYECFYRKILRFTA